MKTRKLYALALFGRRQGTTYRICTLESWFSTTRRREAEAAAARYNRKHECSFDSKFCDVETL